MFSLSPHRSALQGRPLALICLTTLILSFLSTALFAAPTGEQAPPTPTAAPAPTPEVPMPAPKALAQPSSPMAPTQLPGTSASTLSREQQEALAKIMGEGPCLCAPDRSLLACIQAASCPAATKLAQFGVAAFQQGMSAAQVRERVIQRFIMLARPPATFTLEGVPHKGPVSAPIVIVEFADFQCPYCAMVRKEVAQLQAAFPDQVVVYFKQFPLPSHPHSEKAALAALAAHRQNAFWSMHELIFSNQESLNAGSFSQFARMLSLNLERFDSDMNNAELRGEIARDREEGVRAQLTGTPTIFINGRIYPDDMTFLALKAYVQSQLDAIQRGG
ncbi:MAG: thioredoxin domain-containing protein [Myxococcota bacterium]|nr:thioredoxin domain-containing protein [Myxococcota bacterium]